MKITPKWIVIIILAGLVSPCFASVAYRHLFATLEHAEWAIKTCITDDLPAAQAPRLPPFSPSWEQRVTCEDMERFRSDTYPIVRCYDMIPAVVYPPGWMCDVDGKSLGVDAHLSWNETRIHVPSLEGAFEK